MKLFTVGPVACYPEVLEEMKHQMFSHRSKEYRTLHKETVEMMQRFLETENPVFLFPSSGTGFMEASVRNCVEKKMLCCVCGEFGERFSEAATSNGRELEKIKMPLGEPVTPDLLDDTLKRIPDVEAVSITHNETSIGLINPLRELAEVVKKHGKLLFVDAVSSMGGTEIKVDEWELDVCFTSSQKCFGIPPGLAVGSVRQDALRKSETMKNKGLYFDFKLFEKYHKNNFTPTTPPIPQILGLNRILKMIDEMGGKERYFNTYAERSRRIREGIKKLGLTLFPKKGYESPTVTCVNAPDKMTGLEVYQSMREKGFELAKGYGALVDKTFRIGNMGYIEFKDIEMMLKSLVNLIR